MLLAPWDTAKAWERNQWSDDLMMQYSPVGSVHPPSIKWPLSLLSPASAKERGLCMIRQFSRGMEEWYSKNDIHSPITQKMRTIYFFLNSHNLPMIAGTKSVTLQRKQKPIIQRWKKTEGCIVLFSVQNRCIWEIYFLLWKMNETERWNEKKIKWGRIWGSEKQR